MQQQPSQGSRLSSGIAACCALFLGCTTTVGGGQGTDPDGTPLAGSAGMPASGGTGATGGATSPAGGAPRGAGGAGATGSGGTGAQGSGGTGATGGAGGSPVVHPDPPPFQPAAGMLRRLTRTQFRNAVRDVFGVEVDLADLDSDSWNGNFATIGAATVVTAERGVELYHAAIESAVATVFADDAR